MKFQKVHFVINPAAGQPEPILNTINTVLHPHDIQWKVSITHTDGDGKRLAQEAVTSEVDLVVAYGGDGTVKDVANGLMESDIPLALLHGGTGNALASELGIPRSLQEAVALIVGENQIKSMDLGKAICHDESDTVGYFLLRMSLGIQTKILETANRDLKTRYGNLAYILASLQELVDSEQATYHLTIDDEAIEGQGLTVMIANSAFIGGQVNRRFAPSVDPSDQLLDVLIFDDNFLNLVSMLTSALQVEGTDFMQHWRGKEITIHQPAGQLVTLDGEVFGHTPVDVTLLPNAIQILVPSENDA